MARIRKQITPREKAILLLLCFSTAGCVGTKVVVELLPEGQTDSDVAGTEGNEDTESIGDGSDDSFNCGNVILEENVYIDYSSYASKLKDMEGVTHIRGYLAIENIDEGLTSLDELKSLRCVDWNLIISGVSQLTTLDALTDLHTVGGDLFIRGNDSLEGLEGIQNIEILGGSALYIAENSMLPTCIATDLYVGFSELGWNGYTCIINNSPDGCENIYWGCFDEYRW